MFTSLPTPPPQPPWEGMHPLVVHFPIALLLFAALFVVLAMIVPKRGWWFSVSALILLAGGTAGAFVSVSTGEAAMNVAEGDGSNDDEMYDVMQKHADVMEQARNVFVALTVVYAGIVIVPLLAKSLRGFKFAISANLVFLAALMGANLLLASGAHLGGRLVHQYGVKSALASEGGAAATAAKKDAAAAEGDMDSSPPDAAHQSPAAGGAKEAPSPAGGTEAPVAEPKQEAPAPEPAKEAPAPEPAKEEAAKEAKPS